MKKRIRARILRSNLGKARYVEYEVPIEESMSIMNVLNYIYENVDSTIAYYCSCRIGKCRGCLMKINGKVGYACTTPVREDVTLEPVPGREVIRDLVVDLDRKTM